MAGTFNALVVEQDDETRAHLAEWLTEAGFNVLTCGGPVGPDYVCPGGRGDVCPLAVSADIIVLDIHLESDTMLEGIPGWQILQYYCEMGKPVVALADAGDLFDAESGESLRVIKRDPERETLVEAAREMLRHISLEMPAYATSVDDLVVLHRASQRTPVAAP